MQIVHAHAILAVQWERHLYRWQDGMNSKHLNSDMWRKSSEWFGLTRAHAELFANETIVDTAFRRECYISHIDEDAR